MKFFRTLKENVDTRLFLNIVNRQDLDSLELMSMVIESKKSKLQKEDAGRVYIKGYVRYDEEGGADE